MSEFYDNLPADFDDLEKYAPSLVQIARRDGFVVPGNYFEDLPAHIQSLASIADAAKERSAGFHFPETYFDEFPELLRALLVLQEAAKNKHAGLTEPGENYFEELGGQLERLSLLSGILKKENPDIPENYFEQLGEELSTMLALDNLKQEKESMFGVPDGYFEAFAAKVQSRLALEQMKEGNDADVPQGYFEDFAARVQARIREEEKAQEENKNETRPGPKVISIAAHFRRNARVYAAAASLALVLSIGWVLYNNSGVRDKGPGEIVKDNKNVPAPNVLPGNDDPKTPAPAPENYVKKDNEKKENNVKDTAPLVPDNNFVQQPNDTTNKNIINNNEPKFAVAEPMPDKLEGELRDAAINYLAENEDDLGPLFDEIGLKP